MSLPELPEDFRWQLCDSVANRDITHDYLGECDADEARIWAGDDVVLVLKRTGDFGYWGPNGVNGEGGLRKWVVDGRPPEGLQDWEEFETLAEIPHRMPLFD